MPLRMGGSVERGDSRCGHLLLLLVGLECNFQGVRHGTACLRLCLVVLACCCVFMCTWGGTKLGRGGRVCLSLVVFCSWGSAVGQARLEDVPHVASRDGPLLPEGREGVHGPDRQGREGPRMVQRVGK